MGLMRAGYIGLGNIGAPMAERLISSETSLVVFDAVAAAMGNFSGRAKLAGSPAELGREAEFVGICVRDDPDVETVIDGPDGLLRSMKGGAIAIHSTVRPATVIALSQKAAAQNVVLIDAAVTGGAHAAAQGGLTAMVGGTEAQVEKLRPLISKYCSSIVHAGAVGAGMSLKLCNNLVTYLELVAVLESYKLAEAMGIEHERLTAVMMNNGNLTPAMKAYIGFRQTGAATIGADAFLASQKSLAHLAEKDLSLAIEVATEAGVDVPAAEAIRGMFRKTVLKV
jgi:3-hydroxyisobutyrate dehydrogenase